MYAISFHGLPKKRADLQKSWPFILLLLLPSLLQAQAETEVFLLKFDRSSDKVAAEDLKNISNNEGYDNQPSFYNDHLVLFSSMRRGQTDIAAYDLRDGRLAWKTDTPSGGEYSPLRIPESSDFTAIRLDTDGTQLLYRYDWDTGVPRPLIEGLKVGYHVWFSPDIVVSSVLVEDRMDLVVSNLKDATNYTFQRNVGRSLHRIPNTNLISFVHKEDGKRELKSVDPVSGATQVITELPSGIEDVCWLNDGTVLAGKDHQILQFHPGTSPTWTLFLEFPSSEINNISRMANSSTSDLLLLVAEIPGK